MIPAPSVAHATSLSPIHPVYSSAAEDIPDRERIAELLDDLDRVRSGKLARNIRKALESAATQSVATVRSEHPAGARTHGTRRGRLTA